MWQGSLNRKKTDYGHDGDFTAGSVYGNVYCTARGKTDSRGKMKRQRAGRKQNQTAQADSTKRTVVLDSGHGGFDPGKESSDGILAKTHQPCNCRAVKGTAGERRNPGRDDADRR